MDEITQSYINRNVKIIRRFLELLKEGKVTRQATEIVAKETNISEHTVHKIFFDKEYSHAAQAWAIIHKEEAEKEKLKKEKPGTATTKEVATA